MAKKVGLCLNPCSNGIGKYFLDTLEHYDNWVLILVLMEYENTYCNLFQR